MTVSWKDVLIGVLVAYVVIDMLLAYATNVRHPTIFDTLQRSFSDENVAVVVVVGLGVGFLAYYLSMKSRERFSIKNTTS